MIADGTIKAVREAAQFADLCQDACNLYAIANEWVRHMKAMREAGVVGDALNNHPVTLAFASKLVSLSRMDSDRESAALYGCSVLAAGGTIDYEVLPL